MLKDVRTWIGWDRRLSAIYKPKKEEEEGEEDRKQEDELQYVKKTKKATAARRKNKCFKYSKGLARTRIEKLIPVTIYT